MTGTARACRGSDATARKAATRLLAVFGVMVMAVGCGSSGPAITRTAAAQLQADVSAIRAAAAAGDRAAAATGLDTLRRHVTAFQQAGQVSSAAATRIVQSVGVVSANLVLLPAPTTTTTTSTTVAPASDSGSGSHGHGHQGDGGGD